MRGCFEEAGHPQRALGEKGFPLRTCLSLLTKVKDLDSGELLPREELRIQVRQLAGRAAGPLSK